MKIKLHYRQSLTQMVRESLTNLVVKDLAVGGVHAHQISASTIKFDSDEDYTLALLLLSGAEDYRIGVIE